LCAPWQGRRRSQTAATARDSGFASRKDSLHSRHAAVERDFWGGGGAGHFAGGVRLGFTVRHWLKSSLYAPDARLFKGDGKLKPSAALLIGFLNFCRVHSAHGQPPTQALESQTTLEQLKNC